MTRSRTKENALTVACVVALSALGCEPTDNPAGVGGQPSASAAGNTAEGGRAGNGGEEESSLAGEAGARGSVDKGGGTTRGGDGGARETTAGSAGAMGGGGGTAAGGVGGIGGGGATSGAGGATSGGGGTTGGGAGTTGGGGGTTGGGGGTTGGGGRTTADGGTNAGGGGTTAGGAAGMGGSGGTGGGGAMGGGGGATAGGGTLGSGGSAGGFATCSVAADPHVDFVAPYLAVANQPSTLIVRGSKFDVMGPTLMVRVGALRIGPLAHDSETQVTVQVPPLPAARYPVQIENGDCLGTSSAELVVSAPLTPNAQIISAPSKRQRLVYDAERQTLYAVNRTDQEIERYRYANGVWTTLQPYIIADLTDIALSPSGATLVVSTRGAIGEIDLTQPVLAAQLTSNNPDPFCGGYFDNLTMTNDGNVFVIFDLAQCSGFTGSYMYSLLTHSLQSNPYAAGWFYQGVAGGSLDGSRVYVGSNGVSPAQTISIFNTLSHTFTANTPASYNLYTVTVSSNASRVILQDTDVYSRALSLTGHLPRASGVLAANDSTRAFVYDEAGPQPELIVYDLDGALEAGALYPVQRKIALAASANTADTATYHVTMTSSPSDSVVFISGSSRILVVPID